MLASILGNWRLVVGGLVGVGLIAGWLYISHLRSKVEVQAVQIGQLARDRDQAVQIARNNADAVEAVRTAGERALAALTADRDAKIERMGKINGISNEIARAPASDDGPIAPVLRRALDRLRDPARADPGPPN